MTYRIEGLEPAQFTRFFQASDEELAGMNAKRLRSTGPGFPCRISLEDAPAGESLLLLNHTSHDVATPYRSTYAIYVREGQEVPSLFVDEPAPVMLNRPLGLRAFDSAGMLKDARLALPGKSDEKIRELFDNPDVTEIHAHNAAHGCFVARVVRD